MYQLCVYVPESHLTAVKQALFTAGAGALGEYSQCCWQTLGTGQFQPSSASQPFIGEPQQLTQVAEWKLELVVERALIKPVLQALVAAHPYEEPAYHVLPILTLADF